MAIAAFLSSLGIQYTTNLADKDGLAQLPLAFTSLSLQIVNDFYCFNSMTSTRASADWTVTAWVSGSFQIV
jgi:hypothetical protein